MRNKSQHEETCNGCIDLEDFDVRKEMKKKRLQKMITKFYFISLKYFLFKKNNIKIVTISQNPKILSN